VSLHIVEAKVKDEFQKLNSVVVPTRLRRGRITVLGQFEHFVTVATHRWTDSQDVSTALLEALRFFDHHDTPTALAMASKELGESLTNEVVVQLMDYGLLIPNELSKDEQGGR